MSVSPARAAAFDVLDRIERDRAFSSFLLPQFTERLSTQDRRLCYEIVLGVLRNQLLLDRLISCLVGRRKLDREVAIALRIGIYQLRFLDRIPDYSAINDSVGLVQRAKKTSAKAFVNAILRKYQKAPPDVAFSDEIDRISAATSHPRWLIEKWSRDLGAERAEAVAMANNTPPPAAFRIITVDDSTAALVSRSRPSAFVEGCFLTERPIAEFRSMIDDGKVYLQGEASQLTARCVVVPAGGRFLDVCAAPGGKTTLIANRFGRSEVFVAAGDLHRARVEHLRRNCAAQNAEHISILQYDAATGLPFAPEVFDAVLVDAPCSGRGTIRSNPELRYSLNPVDIPAITAKQLTILSNASKLVRIGGSLVYSTCSFEPEENERVCETFLRENRDFGKVVPKVPERFVTGDGFARTWPDRDGMEGFFIASFIRN